MQAKIKPNRHIRDSLRYNEQKVVAGKAERIGAENFLKGYDRLSDKDILTRFRQRSSFNERHSDYGVHFSLNFGKAEKIDREALVQIAMRYMNGMGFEDLPYVVYQHHDAGHTHLHIVACGVHANGSWMKLTPKDYLASKALCTELEKEFSLEKSVRAAPHSQWEFATDHAKKVKYGEPGLMRSMSDVLNTVVDHYRYTSIEELNAILKQYNVEANPGLPDSRLRKFGGVVFHALDEDGKHIGVPIKASLFLLKPTMKRLEQKFEESRPLRESARESIHMAIKWALAGRAPTWGGFLKSLEKEGIAAVINKKEDGQERLFFVDHGKKCAFASESIAADLNLPALRSRCVPEEQLTQQQEQRLNLRL